MGAATACSSDTTSRPERGRGMGEVRTYQRGDIDQQTGALVLRSERSERLEGRGRHDKGDGGLMLRDAALLRGSSA
jgi:hypothetical protein